MVEYKTVETQSQAFVEPVTLGYRHPVTRVQFPPLALKFMGGN